MYHFIFLEIFWTGDYFFRISLFCRNLEFPLPWVSSLGILKTSNGQLRNAVEINGVGAESKVPVGILDVKMDIIPRLPDVAPPEVVKTQLTLEKNRLNERQRLFLGKKTPWVNNPFYLHKCISIT